MRHVLIGVFILILGGMASAQDYTSSEYCDPWCASVRGGGLDCSYQTLQQCLATAAGKGYCYNDNPFLYQCRRSSPAHSSARGR
jgi:Protein of unknown function (DUF3551)